ncbi:MAG: CPBP family intramembrane glutamic endopeptidase [Hyphomicrobium sp.]|nr:CPBP family intramembrane glutamic endopeptidase [Hyphomicrobium sp.]
MTSATLGDLFRGPARYRAESPWRPIAALLGTVLICTAALFLVAGVMAAWSALDATGGPSDTLIERLSSLAAIEGAALAAATQIISLVLLWLLAGWGGRRAAVLKLDGPASSTALLVGAGLLLVAITGLLELSLYQFMRFDIFADVGWIKAGLDGPAWWLTAIVAVVLAPLWEELTFRGFLLSALAKTALGFWPAAILSNVIWTALHASYSIPGLASVFVAGLVLSWVVWRTNSIWPAIAAHAIGNMAALAFTQAFAPSALPG